MSKLISSRWLASLVAIFLLLSMALPGTLRAAPSPLDPRLLNELTAAPDGQADFLVFLQEQADLSAAVTLANRSARVDYVYQTLRAVAERSQAGLRADLDAWGVPYHPFFIVNAIRVSGDLALAQKLVARPEVDRVVADPSFDGLDDPPPGSPGPTAIDAVQNLVAEPQDSAKLKASPWLSAVEWNIARVHADDAWLLGHTGQNIVVGSVDTGVDWDHPALINQYRGSAGNHDYHWYDVFYEYTDPTDPNGHGTHTTGTMVGDDGGTNQIGMAPGAQWVACKVNSGGTWKASKYIECWEWMLAPTRVDGSDPDPSMAPHVINNSWSCPGSEGCDPDTLRDAAKALYAAGIAIAKSGGNAGPNCATITVPGHYPELLATASFNSSDVIAGSSSRGPVSVDGETRIKPDIAAPGVSIRSATPGGGYGSLSGTSMAAPHTAGLIALLWSAQPALIGDLETTYQIVRATAEPKIDLQCQPNGPGGRPNNVWGWGIIDALAAVQAATTDGVGILNGTVSDSGSGSPLAGALVEIAQAGNGPTRKTLTDPAGFYSETLLAATYDVTATLYGYLPTTVVGVGVASGTVTPLDLSLDPAPLWTLAGTVTEQGSGAPLRATLSLLGTPVSVHTDPATGNYSTSVAQGDYVLRASSPGYLPQERDISVQGDLIEDFQLEPVQTYYWRDNTTPCGPAFDWIDISATGQAHNLSDDSYAYINLGGPLFPFYDTSYNALYVGSNGYVSFGSGSSYPGGNTIPSTFLPNNAIYAFWDDLNPASGGQGTIYSELIDDHLFVIEFYQVEHWPSGDPETFEVILDLDSGTITMQYLTVSNSGWTSVGIENSDGSMGHGYSFHDPAMPTDTLAITFYPVTGEHPAEQGLGTLSGTVVASPTMAPIPGATVTALAYSLGSTFTATTDLNGSYGLDLCTDWYMVTATATGYYSSAPQQVTVYSGSVTVQDFVLEPTPACTPVLGADFDWLPLTPTVGQVVSFSGSASGTAPITFAWDFGDGNGGSGANVTHTYDTADTFTVVLTATNCQTGTAIAVHTVTVACDLVHGAGFGWLPLTPTVGQVVSFSGSASGTAPITFAWDFGDGNGGSGANVTHTYDTADTFTVVLTPTNCDGAGIAALSHTLTVVSTCDPVQLITVSSSIDGCTVDFAAEVTGTAPFSWLWEFGDGLTATLDTPTHVYTASDTYTVTLHVRNCADTGHLMYSFTVTVDCAPAYKIFLPLILKSSGP